MRVKSRPFIGISCTDFESMTATRAADCRSVSTPLAVTSTTVASDPTESSTFTVATFVTAISMAWTFFV